MKGQPEAWSGAAAMRPGIGVFTGHAGDNKRHRHWAHQITIGLQGPVTILTEQHSITALGVFIRAGNQHRLNACEAISLYIDPTSNLAGQLLAEIGPSAGITTLPEKTTARLLAAFPTQSQLDQAITRVAGIHGAYVPASSEIDNVRSALEAGLRDGTTVDRAMLAALVERSPSRFSHWFREQTGMPLRSYRKWLRLVLALECAASGRSLIDAAMTAGFSDQAHFSRAVSEAFGITPKALIQLFGR